MLESRSPQHHLSQTFPTPITRRGCCCMVRFVYIREVRRIVHGLGKTFKSHAHCTGTNQGHNWGPLRTLRRGCIALHRIVATYPPAMPVVLLPSTPPPSRAACCVLRSARPLCPRSIALVAGRGAAGAFCSLPTGQSIAPQGCPRLPFSIECSASSRDCDGHRHTGTQARRH